MCGVDVSRKILILARESGYKLEIEDIKINHFLPNDSIKAESKEDFLLSLENNKDHFNTILKKSQENNSRLKFVAKLDKGKASVGLESVSSEHPFYDLVGSDNITVLSLMVKLPDESKLRSPVMVVFIGSAPVPCPIMICASAICVR